MNAAQFLKTAFFAALAGWAAIDVYLAITIPYSVPGASALTLFQWDAATLIGSKAYSEGWSSVAFGLAADLVVSFVWACIWTAAANRIEALRRNPVLWGIAFGVVVMCVMGFVVVPLGGHVKPSPPTIGKLANNLVAHTLFFGVPLALAARKIWFYGNRVPNIA